MSKNFAHVSHYHLRAGVAFSLFVSSHFFNLFVSLSKPSSSQFYLPHSLTPLKLSYYLHHEHLGLTHLH